MIIGSDLLKRKQNNRVTEGRMQLLMLTLLQHILMCHKCKNILLSSLYIFIIRRGNEFSQVNII